MFKIYSRISASWSVNGVVIISNTFYYIVLFKKLKDAIPIKHQNKQQQWNDKTTEFRFKRDKIYIVKYKRVKWIKLERFKIWRMWLISEGISFVLLQLLCDQNERKGGKNNIIKRKNQKTNKINDE